MAVEESSFAITSLPLHATYNVCFKLVSNFYEGPSMLPHDHSQPDDICCCVFETHKSFSCSARVSHISRLLVEELLGGNVSLRELREQK